MWYINKVEQDLRILLSTILQLFGCLILSKNTERKMPKFSKIDVQLTYKVLSGRGESASLSLLSVPTVDYPSLLLSYHGDETFTDRAIVSILYATNNYLSLRVYL